MKYMIFKSLYYPYLIYSTNQINAFLKSLISLSLVLKKLMNGIAIYLYLKKINIGISISGNPKHAKDNRRRIRIKNFLEFKKFSRLFVIQKELYKEDEMVLKMIKILFFLVTR